MDVRPQSGRAAPQPVAGNAPNPHASAGVPASIPASIPVAAADEPARRSAYGLPCAKCGMYYEASLPQCPICKSAERVAPRHGAPSAAVQTSPTQSLPPVAPGAVILGSEALPDGADLDEERDRFLRELKAQLYQTPVKLHAGEGAPCARHSAHAAEPGAAEICRDCYDEAQESADRMEAALHMDVKEAGKIIYEAVWADTSDPEKTYLNAANALLHELRTRAGLPGASVSPGNATKYSH